MKKYFLVGGTAAGSRIRLAGVTALALFAGARLPASGAGVQVTRSRPDLSYTRASNEGLDRLNWERPRTTRRCLQPPKSERCFTLWAEGKLIFGEMDDGGDAQGKANALAYQTNLVSCGIWLLHGKGMEQFDFRAVKNTITEDGVPVHGITHRLGPMEVAMEAFCDTSRKATCYVRTTVRNTGGTELRDRLSFLVRTGLEASAPGKTALVSGGSDQYIEYNPDVNVWKANIPFTWRECAGGFTDGERVLKVWGSQAAAWDAASGAIDAEIVLRPGESREIFMSLNKGENASRDYLGEKAKTERFWRGELARLNKLPPAWLKDSRKMKLVRHFTAQLLQLFAYPAGKDYLLWRQGGLQRIIWPGEALSCFDALAKLGDFADYTEPVLDTYFTVMQRPDGEIVNIGIRWATDTGSALFSLARTCLGNGERGRAYFARRRSQAFAAFDWMKGMRASTLESETLARGLFPPRRASDAEAVFQVWQMTDTWNILDLKAFAEAAESFNDSRAREVREEHDRYLAAFKTCLRPFFEGTGDADEVYIPLCPLGGDERQVARNYPLTHFGDVARCGALDRRADAEKIYRWMVNSHRTNGGLYGRWRDRDPKTKKTHWYWYVSIPDYTWFETWRIFGVPERMHEILRDQLDFAMTRECYMVERFKPDTPYYVPWSPNASAMGRTLLMMLALPDFPMPPL